MSIQSIQKTLAERFIQPLPDFHKRRIIFWHDPEAEFAEHIDELKLDNAELLKLNNANWFYAKKLLCHDDLKRNYLVYIPFSFQQPDDNWLRGLERLNEEFRADIHSMRMEELNMPQTVALRRAVKLYARFFDSRERTEKLKALGSVYSSPGQLHFDVLAVLCKASSNSFSGIIKAFFERTLCDEDDELLPTIEKFGSIAALREMFAQKLGFISEEQAEPIRFAGAILSSALAVSLGKNSLNGLENLIAEKEQCRQNCFDIVSAWLSTDDRNFLYELSSLVDEKYSLSEKLAVLDTDELIKSELLPCVDKCILKHYYNEIMNDVVKTEEIISVTESRRTSSWFERYVNYYDGIYYTARIRQFIQQHSTGYHYSNSKEMFDSYCGELYMMDTYYRHFYFALRRSLGDTESDLEDLFKSVADYAERLYKNGYLANIGTAWDKLFADDNFLIDKTLIQDEFYNKKIKNTSESSRVFVIISDALRYEVAAELNEKLIRETKGTAIISAMRGVFPSITKLGMAVLLPHTSVTMTDNGNFICDEKECDTTEKRRDILKQMHSGNEAITAQALFSMKKAERRSFIRDAKVVYIYHNTIDAVGDKIHTEGDVFEACSDTINELKTLVRIIINDMNGTRIFITADHGFIYTHHPLAESEKGDLELINGSIIESGHRYMIADSKSTPEYLMRIPLEHFKADVYGFAPKGYVRIKKQGGGVNYVHGGTSLQELAVPVIEFRNLRVGQKDYVETRKAMLQLLSRSRRVSNTIFHLDFYQPEAIGGKLLPNEFELYFSDESGKPVSDVQLVIADKTTENVNDRVFRKRFSMKNISYSRTEKYYLNIVERDTRNCVERIEYTVNIAFVDDFDF